MKKTLCMVLSVVMLLALLTACGEANDTTTVPDQTPDSGAVSTTEPETKTEAEPQTETAAYELNAEGSVTLKATGLCTYSFAEEQEDAWADAVNAVFVREMPADPAAAPVTDSDKVDLAKATVSTTKVILDSDLFAVEASSKKTYEITIRAEGYDDYHVALTVENLRPTEFVIRTINADGSVASEKTFSYDEMKALCTKEAYTSAACVMHGLNNYHVLGVELNDLFAAAGVEFTEGMSLAMRTTDAPAKVEATEVNNGNKTGAVVENPESYWIKARYTDYYKMTYENLMGRERYFVSAPYDDAEIGKMLAEDGAAWSIDARVKLAESGLYTPVQPMIAIQYESFEYNTDPRDPRTNTDIVWKLSAEERGFAFVFGLAMDDDPTVNTTAYDNDAKCYPIVEDAAYAGVQAIEEGPDACGTSARQAKLVFGIDIFLDGSIN